MTDNMLKVGDLRHVRAIGRRECNSAEVEWQPLLRHSTYGHWVASDHMLPRRITEFLCHQEAS